MKPLKRSRGIERYSLSMVSILSRRVRFYAIYNPIVYPLADKPNRIQEADSEDKHFAEVIRRGALEPSKRYIEPQTENQEYGWISQPLMVTDRFDSRFNHPKVACEITKFMDTFWKLNEQRKLNS
ncbi:hypothetical protein EWB00_009624 [Schistosoma japonicum]|uniref:Protein FAM183A n=1 Tax=Schistosoma japonicum TaxID=6182 RepID=A0A4Z2CLK3_SCHJA|nr:family with sequence similarity 183 member A [Schistosoma japonicum]TNN05149.1 hypothetical protein EWB00_009624 [Schistosoma japonicum]